MKAISTHTTIPTSWAAVAELGSGRAQARDPDCRRRVQRHGDAEERGQPLSRFPERWRANSFFGGQFGKATAATGAESTIASTVARLAATEGRGPARSRPGDGAVRTVSQNRESSARWSKTTDASGASGPSPWKRSTLIPLSISGRARPARFRRNLSTTLRQVTIAIY